MPRMPMIAGAPSQQITTDTFAGYNHNLKIGNGEFYNTENLSTEQFPMLANRRRRGKLERTLTDLRGIIAKQALYYVENGSLYNANDPSTALLTGLQTQAETQLVSMGSYICVFPDNKYVNTMDTSDKGSMDASWTYTGNVSYTMCHQDGSEYGQVTKGASAPEEPENGDVWIDTGEGSAKEWSAYSASWVVIETVYTRVDFLGTMTELTRNFKEYDGVEISGLHFDDLNGSKILYGIGGQNADGEGTGAMTYIVLIGILEENSEDAYSEGVTISRQVPTMDFVCEAQNRLWGCFYGNIPGVGNINELYCCALGDFKNWSQFLGLSTDSWRASVGSDGPWTGAVNYLGSPTFFKENRIHQISVSSVGAHQVGDLPARGVQQGSHKSLAIVNETLYYKTRSGVVAWQGGIPADVGAALGDVNYYEATAGVYGQRYYLSMRDGADAWNLFVLDVKNGLWMREDDLHAEGFAAWGDELYAWSGNEIIAINGTVGTKEEKIQWFAETGVLYYEFPNHKYVSRYNLRLKMERGARLQLYLEYDSSGTWEFSGEIKVCRLDSFTVPVRPRRCDHMRLKLVGEGDVRIFSMVRVLESGSEV